MLQYINASRNRVCLPIPNLVLQWAGMRSEIITTVERLFEIEVAWDELYRADPHAHLYLSSDFLCSIAIRSAGRFRIVVAWSDEDVCVGLIPLLITTRWSKTRSCLTNGLDMLGHVFDADYTGILCAPAHEAAVCRTLAHEIARMDFNRLILNYFRGPPSRLGAFVSAFDATTFDTKAKEQRINDGQTNNLICPSVDLPSSFDAYLAGLSSNTRQKLRRLMRQFDGDPRLKIRKSRPETFTEDVTILSKLWYLKHAKDKGKQRASRLAELCREATMLGLANGMVYLAILWRDGAPIAAQANYLDNTRREVLFHVAGRDDAVRDLSVGLLLQAYCIRWAIANGYERYDFTIGDEPYKYSLGGVDREIASAEVFTRSGINTAGRLDPGCRDDVEKAIKGLAKQGREEDARTAAKQAARTWPDFAIDEQLKPLVNP